MEKEATNKKIYADVLTEYHAREGMTYEEIQTGIENEYRRRVSNYLGADYPAFEGEGMIPGTTEKREAFRKKMQNNGRLPK